MYGVQLAQTFLLIVAALVLRDLTRSLGGGEHAANLAFLLMLSYPPLVAYAHYLWPEVLHLTLWLSALWIVVSGRRDVGWLVVLMSEKFTTRLSVNPSTLKLAFT